MKRTVSALTLVAALSAFTAPTVNAMGQELTMLELAVNNAMQQIGIQDVDVSDLTLGQLALIKAVLEGDDETGIQKRRIENIVSR